VPQTTAPDAVANAKDVFCIFFSFINEVRDMTGRIHVPTSFGVIPGGQFRKNRPLRSVKPGGVGSTQSPDVSSKVYGLGHESLKLGFVLDILLYGESLYLS
jgi:hypothetical protein